MVCRTSLGPGISSGTLCFQDSRIVICLVGLSILSVFGCLGFFASCSMSMSSTLVRTVVITSIAYRQLFFAPCGAMRGAISFPRYEMQLSMDIIRSQPIWS